MSEVKHTPVPWSLCDDGGRYLCLTISGEHHPILKVYQGKWGDTYPALRHIGDSSLDQRWEPYIEMIEYGEIQKEVAIENAKLIIKAVNSHEALVEALKAFLDDLPNMVIDDGAREFFNWMGIRLTQAQAALKLAGEETLRV